MAAEMSHEWRFRAHIEAEIDAVYAQMGRERTPQPIGTVHEEPEIARSASQMSTRGVPDERVRVLAVLLTLVDRLVAAAPEERPPFRDEPRYRDLPPRATR